METPAEVDKGQITSPLGNRRVPFFNSQTIPSRRHSFAGVDSVCMYDRDVTILDEIFPATTYPAADPTLFFYGFDDKWLTDERTSCRRPLVSLKCTNDDANIEKYCTRNRSTIQFWKDFRKVEVSRCQPQRKAH